MTQTVAITGASAGIGRAAARLFGERGDRVALIARGRAGLEGAVRDVERAGGNALAVPADVADYAQVDAAAKEIEADLRADRRVGQRGVRLGVRPVRRDTAEEFRRVTEVSYLGLRARHHGRPGPDAAARPRHHRAGRVRARRAAAFRCSRPTAAPSTPSTGSPSRCAASSCTTRPTSTSPWCRCRRSIPRSSPGCCPGCPGIRSRSRRSTSPRWRPAPSSTPPTTRGASSTGSAPAPPPPSWPTGRARPARPVPGQDRLRLAADRRASSPSRPDNLWEPVDEPRGDDHGAHGEFDDRSHSRSAQQLLSHHPVAAVATGAATAAAGLVLASRARRR